VVKKWKDLYMMSCIYRVEVILMECEWCYEEAGRAGVMKYDVLLCDKHLEELEVYSLKSFGMVIPKELKDAEARILERETGPLMQAGLYLINLQMKLTGVPKVKRSALK
jgi:hypothetical protein